MSTSPIPRWKGMGATWHRPPPATAPHYPRITGISHLLAAGVPIFDVSRYAGTSLQMIERTYGHLVAGSVENARARLDAFREQRATV